MSIGAGVQTLTPLYASHVRRLILVLTYANVISVHQRSVADHCLAPLLLASSEQISPQVI